VRSSLILFFLTCAMLAIAPHSADAQSQARGFVGVALLGASDDTSNRVRFPDEGASRVLALEADLMRAGTLAIGVEASHLGSVTGAYNAQCCIFRDEQREIAVLGVLRERVWNSARVALDIVGGAGALFQHRETLIADRFFPSAASTVIEDRGSPAFVLGADLPIALAEHLALSPELRWYFLQRGSLDTLNVTRQSSNRPAVGVSGRLTW
jgi:hypothetical protein